MNHRNWLAIRVGLTVIVIAGLAVDAWIHWDLAATYDPVSSTTLSEGDLFRVEGSVAILAALLLLLRPRRYSAALAFLVAAGGLAAVLVYQYVDLGSFGPFPDMYDPEWYAKKTQSAYAEGIAALGAALLFVTMHLQSRITSRGTADLAGAWNSIVV